MNSEKWRDIEFKHTKKMGSGNAIGLELKQLSIGRQQKELLLFSLALIDIQSKSDIIAICFCSITVYRTLFTYAAKLYTIRSLAGLGSTFPFFHLGRKAVYSA